MTDEEVKAKLHALLEDYLGAWEELKDVDDFVFSEAEEIDDAQAELLKIKEEIVTFVIQLRGNNATG